MADLEPPIEVTVEHGKVGWLERVLEVKIAQANHLSWIKVDFARHMLQFKAGWAKIG